MTVFVDNDIAWKLCACGLAGRFCDAFVGRSIRLLPTARFKFQVQKPTPKTLAKYGASTHARLCSFVDRTDEIAGAPSSGDLVKLLVSTDSVDPGEALLFALAADTPGSLVVTGDKRSIIALGGMRDPLVRSLDGRVLCFEQVMRALIEADDFEAVRDGAIAAHACDAVLRVAFSASRTREETRDALDSYITNLRVQTGPLLLPDGAALALFGV